MKLKIPFVGHDRCPPFLTPNGLQFPLKWQPIGMLNSIENSNFKRGGEFTFRFRLLHFTHFGEYFTERRQADRHLTMSFLPK